MMGPVWLWLLVAKVLLPVHCQPFSPHGEKSLGVPQPASHQLLEPAPAYGKVTPTITNFALRLYKQLAEDVPGNILFSPVSLSSILALLSLGAPADTQIQILESLGFNLTETPAADVHRGFQSLLHTLDLPSPKLELKVGHSLFLDRQLKPQQRFLDSAKELYGALAFSANFTDAAATGQQINDLVRKQTYGQVVDSLPEFGPDTVMVLLNYIFFKAKWKHPFDRYQTRKQESFSRDQRTALRIPMMRQKEMHRFLYDQEASCTVLQIEYSGTALLLLVLPDPGKMQQVEAALQPETLRRWSQRFLPSLLDLHLPRFSISASYNLEEILPLIGLSNMFDMEDDLSGIMGLLNRTVSRDNPSLRGEKEDKRNTQRLLTLPSSTGLCNSHSEPLIKTGILCRQWERAGSSPDGRHHKPGGMGKDLQPSNRKGSLSQEGRWPRPFPELSLVHYHRDFC